jgi:WD40 repeat protein
VRIWDPASGALLAVHPTNGRPVWSLAWSPDGSRLAAGDGLYDNAHAASSIFILAMP